jgi:hypothetical protein
MAGNDARIPPRPAAGFMIKKVLAFKSAKNVLGAAARIAIDPPTPRFHQGEPSQMRNHSAEECHLSQKGERRLRNGLVGRFAIAWAFVSIFCEIHIRRWQLAGGPWVAKAKKFLVPRGYQPTASGYLKHSEAGLAASSSIHPEEIRRGRLRSETENCFHVGVVQVSNAGDRHARTWSVIWINQVGVSNRLHSNLDDAERAVARSDADVNAVARRGGRNTGQESCWIRPDARR